MVDINSKEKHTGGLNIILMTGICLFLLTWTVASIAYVRLDTYVKVDLPKSYVIKVNKEALAQAIACKREFERSKTMVSEPPKTIPIKTRRATKCSLKKTTRAILSADKWLDVLEKNSGKYLPKDKVVKETEENKDLYEKVELITHQVKEGEGVNQIARRYNVRPLMIKECNGLDDKLTVYPDQNIRIISVNWKAQKGLASWYGWDFAGKSMANGKDYDPNMPWVAHRLLPLGTKVLIKNLDNGKEVVAEVVDRGPYVPHAPDRIVDCSFYVMNSLGGLKPGVIPVEVRPINL